jgi:hypothetical protein
VNSNSTGQNQNRSSAIAPSNAARKPYVKPMVRHERVFETMALTCGKVQSTQGGCHFNRKTS